MAVETNNKTFISFIPWLLPAYQVLPYAFIASEYRGLQWVWATGYAPFWGMLILLFILAAISSLLLWKLQDVGAMIFRVGYFLAMIHGAHLAMSERRHALLILVFLLFASGVFLSEKIRKVLRLPYYDSRRAWWESYPKGIPGLSVLLIGEKGDEFMARLANFGGEGCFVFSETGPIPFSPVSVKVVSQDKIHLEADVRPVLRTQDGFGFGLRFQHHSMEGDWRKDLQDHLGLLRRAGYDVAW